MPRRARRIQRLTQDKGTTQRQERVRETDATDKTPTGELELTARKPSSRVRMRNNLSVTSKIKTKSTRQDAH